MKDTPEDLFVENISRRKFIERATAAGLTLAVLGNATENEVAAEIIRRTPGADALVSIGAFGHGGLLGTFGWADPKRDLVGIFMIQQHVFQSEAPNAMRETFTAMAYAAIAE